MTLEERDEAIEAIKQRKLDKLSEIRPYKRKVKKKKWCIIDDIKEKKNAYAREWYRRKKIEALKGGEQ